MEPATLLARIYLTTDTADFLHYKMHGTLAPRSVAQAAAFPIDLPPAATPGRPCRRPRSSRPSWRRWSGFSTNSTRNPASGGRTTTAPPGTAV